jgi:type I restriction enzyme M protein
MYLRSHCISDRTTECPENPDATETKQKNGSSANLGFEATLWAAADKLRNNMDAAEYKHVVLGLIFLKYISDAFEERRAQILAESSDPSSRWFVRDADEREELLEDRDEYASHNVFWVPPEARWAKLQDNAKQPEIGRIVDEAMTAIERDNPSLKGVCRRTTPVPRSTKDASAS